MEFKNKLLIVDDSPINRSLLIDILSDEYDLIELENGLQAISYMEKHIDEIVLVLLDIIMPVMDGFEVLKIMNDNGWMDSVPVITITSETTSQTIDEAYRLGVNDYINRPFDDLIVQKRVKNTILLFAKQKNLENMVTEQIIEKEKNNLLMIEILSHIVEFRNGESGLHVLRIRIITELLMHELSRISTQYSFTDTFITEVMNASALHDIGKIMISKSILNKPGKLTSEEFDLMKKHSAFGAQILEDVPYFQEESLIQTAHDICLYHHERYDGNGYPEGLIGDNIPISAQIVALADVYDALTSKRVYKPAYSHEEAVSMILHGECGVFNPALISCFEQINEVLKRRLMMYDSKKALIDLESQNMKKHLMKQSSVSNRTLTLLEQERTKYRFFASMSGEIQYEFNSKSKILTLSEWAAVNLGLPEIIVDPFHNPLLLEIIDKKTLEMVWDALHKTSEDDPLVEIQAQLKLKGQWRWFKILTRPLWDEEDSSIISGVIGKCVDFHNEHITMDNLKKIAEQDSLTKLWNHRTARKQIELLLIKKAPVKYALISIDLDNFKAANDSYGHMFGDEVLKFVASQLQSVFRKHEIVSRVGGDEFMAFIPYKDELEHRIQELHRTLTCHYKDFEITTSIGVALYPQDGNDYETLFNCADQALYTAKRNGRKQYRYFNNRNVSPSE